MIETEKQLCNLFCDYAESIGFIIHPEFEGWDMVLLRRNLIIGVQAKLFLNGMVLNQTLNNGGVDIKVIVFHTYRNNVNIYLNIINALRRGIILVQITDEKDAKIFPHDNIFWYRHRGERLELPENPIIVPAGIQSPQTVSQQKIALVKLELLCEKNGGTVTAREARGLGIYKIPNKYFLYDWRSKKYILRLKRPSDYWPHILEGIIQSV